MTRREIVETFILSSALTVMVLWAFDRASTAQRSISALERDGYRGVRIIGSNCHVATAVNSVGENRYAWACPGNDYSEQD